MFQSAPPAKGATLVNGLEAGHVGVSIRAPREGGDIRSPRFPTSLRCFNPRPPRRGRLFADFREEIVLAFQSAPPAKGATRCSAACIIARSVSIRAPREGGDNTAI